jgi:polysaccharide biosynthesis protein VpsF
VLLCATFALLKGVVPFHQRCRNSPRLLLFVFGVPLLAAYTVYFNGINGAAFYFDSFWSAALLALLLESATDKQKRWLARLLMTLVIANVLIGLWESVTQNNWFPFVADPIDGTSDSAALETEDFRANAFYGHPLGASLITSMAFFLLYSMQIRIAVAGPVIGLLLIGLLAFGGRTALGITGLFSIITAIYVLTMGIIRRNLRLDFVMGIMVAAIIVPLLILIIVTQTTIADRIIDTLYFDDSAQVRVTQWMVLDYLSLKNWLFGVPLADLEALKFQIGLDASEDIENFWLLLCLNLGVIGFVVFVVFFGAFLTHVARYGGGLNGWLLMVSTLIIDSSSNSLGTKSNDLFIEVAFLMAMSGFKNYVRQPRAARAHKPTAKFRPLPRALSDGPPEHWSAPA